MSRQASLDLYFKCKSSPAPNRAAMNEKNITMKRRSLSLLKPSSTPDKAPKIKSPNASIVNKIKIEPEVVNLCSDEEHSSPPDCESKCNNLSQNSVNSQGSNSSQSTIIYNLTPSTPQKSSPVSSYFRSPKSGNKFYSPTKKRAVMKRTPVKRNLAKKDYGDSESQTQYDSLQNEDFNKACEGMDDKSIFLLTIINKCLKNNSLKELVDKNSIDILNRCLHVIKPGIRLVCRLYWRQRSWFRREKLLQITKDKKEGGEEQFQEMLNCLVANKLITSSAIIGTSTMTFDDYSKILKGDEIKQICKDLKIKTKSKQSSVEALRSFSLQSSISKYFIGSASNNTKRVLEIMRSKAGTCYKLSELAIETFHQLYLLMYLGMNYESIRERRLEFILINDKILRETYPVDKEMAVDNASVVFRNREEFARYIQAHQIYEAYLTETDTSEKCGIVMKVYKIYVEIDEDNLMRYKALPTWLHRYTPTYICTKILESGIQELKKDKSGKHYDLALDILNTLIYQVAFRQHKKAEWYAEKALILHKLMGRHDEAAEVLLDGLKSGLSEEAKDAMRPRAIKLANQLNIQLAAGLQEALVQHASNQLILERTFPAEHVTKPHMETSNKRGKKKFEVHTEEGKKFVDAEDYCVIHYTTNGDYTHGEHWEGRIVTTIFFLLFWDIIYTKPRGVVGIFLCHYQLYPLDLYTESFYTNRKTLIDDRLLTIENMELEKLIETMQSKWEERPEHEVSGINRSVGWDNVRSVTSCLGCRSTAALCRRLAHNYGYAHSGFPDLTLWNLHTKKIKFVEVKTDTDKPSIKQLQWMQYLRNNGIDTAFCYVGASTTRCRARAVETTALNVKSVADINRDAQLSNDICNL